MTKIVGGMLFWGIMLTIGFFSVAVMFDAAETPSGPLKQRPQEVYEVRCQNETFRVYAPVNSVGYMYTSDGEEISALPDCMTVKVGEAESIGGEVARKDQ